MDAKALVLVLLAGCATTAEDLNAAKNTWFGARYEAAVAQWGAPTRSTVRDDGRDAHTWVSESVVGGNWNPMFGIFGGSRGAGGGVGMSLPGMGGGGELVRCERTLYFKGGEVVEQSWQGQPNYCSTFRRN